MKCFKIILTAFLVVATVLCFTACVDGGNLPDSNDSLNSGNLGEITQMPSGSNTTQTPNSGNQGGTSQTPSSGSDGANTIVVYFSCTNTTKRVAEYIQEELGCDIYEIVPQIPYTSADLNYNNNSSRSSIEQNDDKSRPAIDGQIKDFDKYDVVFIGYPIWWGISPRILYTFVESYDFNGKTVIPFCTSGGSGVGNSATQLARLANGGDWKMGTRLSSSQSSVVSWVKSLSK